MSAGHIDNLMQIETAIAEALVRIERQRQMIADFQVRGYDVSAPLTLLSCMILNLRKLEDRRRKQMSVDVVTV